MKETRLSSSSTTSQEHSGSTSSADEDTTSNRASLLRQMSGRQQTVDSAIDSNTISALIGGQYDFLNDYDADGGTLIDCIAGKPTSIILFPPTSPRRVSTLKSSLVTNSKIISRTFEFLNENDVEDDDSDAADEQINQNHNQTATSSKHSKPTRANSCTKTSLAKVPINLGRVKANPAFNTIAESNDDDEDEEDIQTDNNCNTSESQNEDTSQGRCSLGASGRNDSCDTYSSSDDSVDFVDPAVVSQLASRYSGTRTSSLGGSAVCDDNKAYEETFISNDPPPPQPCSSSSSNANGGSEYACVQRSATAHQQKTASRASLTATDLSSNFLSLPANSKQPVTLTVSKEITIEKSENETYGFSLKNSSSPRATLIVLAVKPGTPAHAAGLVEGSVVLTINGRKVSDCTPDDVINIMQNNCNIMTLGIANYTQSVMCSGLLTKQGGRFKSWHRRWFELRVDGFLYYYDPNSKAIKPKGAVCLANYVVKKATEIKKEFAFKLEKYGQRTYYMYANSEEDMNHWCMALKDCIDGLGRGSAIGLQRFASANVEVHALSVKDADCYGQLKVKQGKKPWKTHYYILKGTCFYQFDSNTSQRANEVLNLIEYSLELPEAYDRKHCFVLSPNDTTLPHNGFQAHNDTDYKRWTEALLKVTAKSP